MTNPATPTKTAARSTKSTTKTTTAKPAAKSTKSTTKSAAAPKTAKSTKSTKSVEPVAEVTKTTAISESDAAALVAAFDAMNAARESFRDLVEHYLRNGVSPTHVGKPIGLGNSSIRRIAFARSIDGIK